MISDLLLITPLGRLVLREENQELIHVFLPGQSLPPLHKQNTPLLTEAGAQFYAYFRGQLKIFDLPYRLDGSSFFMDVLTALSHIPYGETRSYSEFSALCGHPGACRAVGGALHRNPLPILLPCHRVIGANGALTGFAGGLSAKQTLLALEGSSQLILP